MRRRSTAPHPHAEIEENPEHQFGEEADRAGDDHRDHHHLHVAVADMGEFVAEHRLDFLVVERVQAGL
jgi:hypothetical protein